MSKNWVMGVIGTSALLLAASQARAGLDLSMTGDGEGGSFFLNFEASSGSADTYVDTAFNNIRVYVGGPVSFTVTAGTFNITAPQLLNDNGTTHDAIDTFAFVDDFFGPLGAGGWSQTTLTPGPTFGDFARADSGTTFGPGDSLTFRLWFDGVLAQGAHAYIEFLLDDSFTTGYEIKRKNGSTTSAGAVGFESVNYSTSITVPLPTSVWSGMALLGGVGLLAARRRRKTVLA